MKPDLAILYEHPIWFEPLFAALGRRGLRHEAIKLSDHGFDPASTDIPAPVVLKPPRGFDNFDQWLSGPGSTCCCSR